MTGTDAAPEPCFTRALRLIDDELVGSLARDHEAKIRRYLRVDGAQPFITRCTCNCPAVLEADPCHWNRDMSLSVEQEGCNKMTADPVGSLHRVERVEQSTMIRLRDV